MKKSVCFFLVISLIFTLIVPTFASHNPSAHFSDIYEDDPYYSAVMYLYDHDIMVGTSGTLFSPNVTLIRSSIVIALWKMLNKPAPDGQIHQFSDVPTSAYYYPALCWASSSNVGIASGGNNNMFNPNSSVTNQEFFSFLYRFACYSEYACDDSDDIAFYKSVFSASSLENKSSFSNWAKAATGWAIYNGFIDDYSVVGTDGIKRYEVAEYIYSFYQTYQQKYGLVIVNSANMSYAPGCADSMETLFEYYGITTNKYVDITKSSFSTVMSESFSNACKLDICYIYCASHGGTDGLALFTGSNRLLTPSYLRSEIENYQGTFITFISGCHSGTYISEDDNNVQGDSDYFNEQQFLYDLIGEDYFIEEDSDLRGSSRIKAICSSHADELSYSTDRLATYYWCLGAGYNRNTDTFTSKLADANGDGRVSLYELYSYSSNCIVQLCPGQNEVYYPANDNYIIFED